MPRHFLKRAEVPTEVDVRIPQEEQKAVRWKVAEVPWAAVGVWAAWAEVGEEGRKWADDLVLRDLQLLEHAVEGAEDGEVTTARTPSGGVGLEGGAGNVGFRSGGGRGAGVREHDGGNGFEFSGTGFRGGP